MIIFFILALPIMVILECAKRSQRRSKLLRTPKMDQKQTRMRTAGYTACYNAIMCAKLPKPVKYQPFTVYFDREKLDAIRDYYGAELYKECLHEATAQLENT